MRNERGDFWIGLGGAGGQQTARGEVLAWGQIDGLHLCPGSLGIGAIDEARVGFAEGDLVQHRLHARFV
ncbi:MAG: hypothetical protein R3F17_02180 [Planctomycetota bacterium]